MKMAGNSSTPCGATKLHNCSAIPARQVAAPTTPIIRPFSASIHTVPIPAVIPRANVANDTERLLVRIAEAASGLTVTIDCVHIWRFSMDSIMGELSRR